MILENYKYILIFPYYQCTNVRFQEVKCLCYVVNLLLTLISIYLKVQLLISVKCSNSNFSSPY